MRQRRKQAVRLALDAKLYMLILSWMMMLSSDSHTRGGLFGPKTLTHIEADF